MMWLAKSKASTPLLDTSQTPEWSVLFEQLAEQAQDQRLKRYYSTPMVNGDTPLKEVPFVSVDFETTGLNAEDDAILTIGLVPFTIDRVQCSGSAHWIVNPNRELNEESVVIHGITDSEVKNAPQLTQILGEILNALAGKVVLVHYKNIERQFFYNALLNTIGEGIQFPVVDTLDIEYALQRRECSGIWNKLKGKKPGSVRLGHARERYGLPAYQPHHALTDALATAELFQAQLQYHFNRDMPISAIWQ
ncbi:3'-5' exonuclease [Vibrio parahaemolyticus]|uniref:3'-5' exonuclease n=1 Tax=Vibrio parahaemolyticus TaxID=670 RepID=UPI00040005F3|nr:3'-5' exonuclease [Vibrio parahaemolyticus]EGQ8032621.1 3'-5' exonuclease [Vibrio parahaemolyticus]EGQ8233436.1 3'-5' exonuclease [Vibrio parahaemolyticus]EGQ8926497.1 3'-5' exonuclease [Vibrio parahaemolyticus]EGR2692234.1 3'-5' exonuclease [Vibrio parahaemolyticus]EGR2708124.1 3'-5' exonuclease [Vibrio parahaemolyticus]